MLFYQTGGNSSVSLLFFKKIEEGILHEGSIYERTEKSDQSSGLGDILAEPGYRGWVFPGMVFCQPHHRFNHDPGENRRLIPDLIGDPNSLSTYSKRGYTCLVFIHWI